MVMAPAALRMEIPLPEVKVAATGATPVEPIKSWPEVKVWEVTGEVPQPKRMPFKVREVAPVPPTLTARVELEVKPEVVPPPMTMLPEATPVTARELEVA